MPRKFAAFCGIENNETVTEKGHYDFLYHLQGALLLALREQGRLDAAQYRRAEEELKRQRRERAKALLKEGERQ